MANLGMTFNPDEVEEDAFEPLPAGDYLAQIIESEISDTKSGNGQMLKLVFEILSGDQQSRRVWDRLNIVNANPDAQRIAQQQLKRLCDACGTGAIVDSEELHFKPLNIRVGIRIDKTGNYGPQNTITKCWEAGSAQPAQAAKPAAAKAAPKPAAKAAASGGRPWSKTQAA
ncbi:MAG TPA: DUF669 domain-containing protein [Steroidobacteraceae bacterium]|nr:DUF669 domain-containing protein [Steroidobacteraceae bacterium]